MHEYTMRTKLAYLLRTARNRWYAGIRLGRRVIVTGGQRSTGIRTEWLNVAGVRHFCLAVGCPNHHHFWAFRVVWYLPARRAADNG